MKYEHLTLNETRIEVEEGEDLYLPGADKVLEVIIHRDRIMIWMGAQRLDIPMAMIGEKGLSVNFYPKPEKVKSYSWGDSMGQEVTAGDGKLTPYTCHFVVRWVRKLLPGIDR